jgi:phosphoadenosine phosphosulfate reductase
MTPEPNVVSGSESNVVSGFSRTEASSRTDEATNVITNALASPGVVCVTSSFQAEDVVLVDLLRRVQPDIPVLFLETFHHFPQTLTYRDEIAERWKLNLINLRAPEPLVGLWQTSTDDCCARHKVGPLFGALEGYDIWFTGLRRDQSPSRANLQHIEPFTMKSGKVLTKVSPLAAWTTKDVWQYAKAHDIPLLPLYELGYSSIGCEPCTSLPLDPLNPRSGRWQGQKLECGIHIEPTK